MARYKLEISRSAEKQLKKLPVHHRKRVAEAILELASDPYPRGSRQLSGYDDVFRVRVGLYRILYSVAKTRLVIIILKVGHRKDVYR